MMATPQEMFVLSKTLDLLAFPKTEFIQGKWEWEFFLFQFLIPARAQRRRTNDENRHRVLTS